MGGVDGEPSPAGVFRLKHADAEQPPVSPRVLIRRPLGISHLERQSDRWTRRLLYWSSTVAKAQALGLPIGSAAIWPELNGPSGRRKSRAIRQHAHFERAPRRHQDLSTLMPERVCGAGAGAGARTRSHCRLPRSPPLPASLGHDQHRCARDNRSVERSDSLDELS